MKTLTVIDASVFITGIFGVNARVGSDVKNLLRDATREVSVLPFTIVEFANGIRFSTHDPKKAQEAIVKFAALGLSVIPITTADMAAITNLSYTLQTTIYDTAYHYVAIVKKGTFVTCDAAYYKKASHLGYIELWR